MVAPLKEYSTGTNILRYDFLLPFYPVDILFNIQEEKIKSHFPHVDFDKKIYPSAEHIFQAHKSSDTIWQEHIRRMDDVNEIRSLVSRMTKINKPNKKIKNDDGLYFRSNWDNVKIEFMTAIVFLKFDQNEEIRDRLFNVKNVELLNLCDDPFWGKIDGLGSNHYAKILSAVKIMLLNKKRENERVECLH